jgi:hypothetical protein
MATPVAHETVEHTAEFPVVIEKEAPVRRRKAKVKAPTKVERQEILRERIKRLTEALDAAGFGGLLRIPGAVKPIAPEIRMSRRVDISGISKRNWAHTYSVFRSSIISTSANLLII